jgi:hypothetical protein
VASRLAAAGYNTLRQLDRAVNVRIHFPVACYKWFSHF